MCNVVAMIIPLSILTSSKMPLNVLAPSSSSVVFSLILIKVSILLLFSTYLIITIFDISLHLIHFLLQGPDRFHSIEVQYGELQLWLQQKVLFFDSIHQTRGQAPMDYKEYLQVLTSYLILSNADIINLTYQTFHYLFLSYLIKC